MFHTVSIPRGEDTFEALIAATNTGAAEAHRLTGGPTHCMHNTQTMVDAATGTVHVRTFCTPVTPFARTAA